MTTVPRGDYQGGTRVAPEENRQRSLLTNGAGCDRIDFEIGIGPHGNLIESATIAPQLRRRMVGPSDRASTDKDHANE